MGIEKFILVILTIVITSFNLYTAVSFAADPLQRAIEMSSSALKAQSERIKVISQNIANEDSTGSKAGEKPYTRKIIFFKNKKDSKTGADKVVVDKISVDNNTQYKKKYEPSHPASDQNGYVLYPNVDKNLEFVDAKEAQRSYEANLNSLSITNSIMSKTIEILR